MIFCKMRYDHDENGKEILLKEDTFQVMMEWEKPYMQACIDALELPLTFNPINLNLIRLLNTIP